MADPVVRLQALDGQWETAGIDRLRGIVPEDLTLSANEWGSDTASFTLRRDPGAVHPDLTAFTPCDVEIAGELVWSGRVRETPTKDGQDPQISVQGQGWQYHLDDDVYERAYVHTRLGDWKDSRSLSGADLTRVKAAPKVEVGSGAIVLGWANGSQADAGSSASVTLDLGPSSTAKRVVLTDVSVVTPSGSFTMFIRGHDTEEAHAGAAGSYEHPYSTLHNAVAATGAATFSTVRRYVSLVLYRSDGVSGVVTSDILVRIGHVQVFRDTAYESGDASILKASDVVKDARNAATVLLSTDDTGVTATTFSLPELALDGAKTPREVMSGVNAYHDYDLKVDVDKRLVFKPRPSSPLYEVGSWSGADFEDASANSGEEMFNRVIIEATGPDGAPLRLSRTTGQMLNTPISPVSSPAPTNPSAATNTAGWTLTSSLGSLARDTVVFDTSPASFKVTTGGVVFTLTGTFSGEPFVTGRTYRLRLMARASAAGATGQVLRIGDLTSATNYAQANVAFPNGSFAEVTVTWTPTSKVLAANASIEIRSDAGVAGSASVNFDTFELGYVVATLADRRGFAHTKIFPVQSALTDASAQQIADTFLLNHRTTPFKGSLVVTGQGGVREVLGGQPMHPAHLLRETTEFIRFSHRTDPDNGHQGRDGRIASVSYTHKTEQASVQIDNDRQNFEALLARLGALSA